MKTGCVQVKKFYTSTETSKLQKLLDELNFTTREEGRFTLCAQIESELKEMSKFCDSQEVSSLIETILFRSVESDHFKLQHHLPTRTPKVPFKFDPITYPELRYALSFINKYGPSDHLDPHDDGDDVVDGGNATLIMSLSIGQTRELQFINKETGICDESFILEDGDLFLFNPNQAEYYNHHIAPLSQAEIEASEGQVRYSLLFWYNTIFRPEGDYFVSN